MIQLEHEQSQLVLGEDYGWSVHKTAHGSLFFKGYLNADAQSGWADKIGKALVDAYNGELKSLLTLDGHFAAILSMPEVLIATVDRVRAIPLLWALLPTGGYLISDHASPFLEHIHLSKDDIDGDAAQDLALAGYALGHDTLYRPVKAMLPGQVGIFSSGDKKPLIHRYALYRPWLVSTENLEESIWRAELREITLHILKKMINRANGRQILLPLSCGLDSRLIASGLQHLGYKNVHCFSYGRPGNHEAVAAMKIADSLGYPLHFLPTFTRQVRNLRQGSDFSRYMTLADNLVATPFEQDIFTIMELRKQPWADPDGIIVNGQSGDYIAGNHIPPSLVENVPLKRHARDAVIFNAMVNKHFDLWADLRTSDNLSRIQARVWQEFEESNAPMDEPHLAFALYEFSEFQNRQAKYVLGNQRSYEVYGWDWHLPLWDQNYLEFWQKVPLKLKYQQRLYREMLVEANWGGVWTSLLPAPRWITPNWIRPIRYTVRAACAPLGKETWRKIERRFFSHHMDIVRNYAAISYWEVVFGPRHRSAVSWLTALYLSRHGLLRDGTIQ